MEKNFGEKQYALSENLISRLRSSALGQYQFKRKSCEEQFHFNASVEDKFSDIDCSLANLNAESVERAKQSVSEGKSLIQQRKKKNCWNWQILQNWDGRSWANIRQTHWRLIRKTSKISTWPKSGRSEKHVRNSRKSYVLESRQYSTAQHIQPQSQAFGKPATSTATATATRGRPGNCWYCEGGGHWSSECETLNKAQTNNKISNFELYESHFSTQVPTCFHFGDKSRTWAQQVCSNYPLNDRWVWYFHHLSRKKHAPRARRARGACFLRDRWWKCHAHLSWSG